MNILFRMKYFIVIQVLVFVLIPSIYFMDNEPTLKGIAKESVILEKQLVPLLETANKYGYSSPRYRIISISSDNYYVLQERKNEQWWAVDVKTISEDNSLENIKLYLLKYKTKRLKEFVSEYERTQEFRYPVIIYEELN
jgi:hypothetical protein